MFERNVGQVGSEARFLARTASYTAFLSEAQVDLALPAGRTEAGQPRYAPVRMTFDGARVVAPTALAERGPVNYFRGQDPTRWKVGVPLYERVRYDDLWPGIDAELYGNGADLAFDLFVEPGADPSLIRLAFDGVGDVSLDEEGNLQLQTLAGPLVHRAPVLFQQHGAGRVPVEGRFRLRDDGTVGFEVPAYDPTRELVIDPTIVYATFFGGSSLDEIHAIARDAAGDVYVTGVTASADLPTQGPVQGFVNGLYDAFVAKLDATGSSLIYSTYLGGSLGFGFYERGIGIAVDAGGSAIVTGRTDSPDFPVLNAAQPALAGESDAFVTKLSADGSALVYSTYLGGSDFENDSNVDFFVVRSGAVVVDGSGNAYVTGGTESVDFPLLNELQSFNAGFFDVFVTSYDPSGAMRFSTYLGSASKDMGYDLAMATNGDVVVSGMAGNGYPTTPGAHATSGAGFLSRLTPDGQTLVSSTMVPMLAWGVDLDGADNLYFCGTTTGRCLETTFGAYQPDHAGSVNSHQQEMFVAKLDAAAQNLMYATYYGANSANEYGYDIAVNAFGEATVVGTRESHTGSNTSNALVVKFNALGSDLVYSTSFGGRFTDAHSIVLDDDGAALIGGQTSNGGFPATAGAYQTTLGGNTDGFVALMGDTASVLRSVQVETPKAVHGSTIQGSVTLDGAAPAGGVVVSLSSTNPAVASVPANVTVPAGAATATFPITTGPVSGDTQLGITASWVEMRATNLLVWTGPTYRIEYLGTLAGAESSAYGINETGEIAGDSRSASITFHMTRWSEAAGLEDLGAGRGRDINDGGQVAGDSGARALRYTDGVGIENLGTLHGGSQSAAAGINNSGQVVGWSDGNGIQQHAVRYTDGVGWEDLGSLGGALSEAEDINDLGQVCGRSFVAGNTAWHAFRYTDGAGMVDLGTLPGDVNSVAGGINRFGQVVGNSANSGFTVSTVTRYTDGLGWEDLGNLPGESRGQGTAINDAGDVVGWSGSVSTQEAFLYTDVDGMRALSDMIDPAQAFQWTLGSAADLNEGRVICGTGTYRGAGCQTSAWRAVPCGAGWSNYGVGHPGTLGVPALTAAGAPYLCEPFTIRLGNSAGVNTPAFLSIGFAPASVPLPNGATVLVQQSFSIRLLLPAAGQSLTSTLPCDPSLCGLDLYLQSLMVDPGATGGLAFSSGLKVAIGQR